MPGKVKHPFRNTTTNNKNIKENFKHCDNKQKISQKCDTNKTNIKIKSVVNELSENNITLAGFCAVCYNKALFFCPDCKLIGYCCYSHMASHWLKHQELCEIINNKICKKAGNNIYKHTY